MLKKRLHLAGLAVASLGIAGNASATLLNPQYQYSNIDLTSTYLIYDHDALKTYNNGACNSISSSRACIGQFTLVSMSSTLNSGPIPAPTATQMYTYTGLDSTPDQMMTIAVQSSGPSGAVGQLVDNSNTTSSNAVTITPGDPALYNTDTFSWMGDVTNFGYSTDGTAFDGYWHMTSDTYSNLPAGMEDFVDGVLTSAMANFDGGFKISNSAGFGSVSFPNALKRDWVFGMGATNSIVQGMIAPYLTGLSTTSCANANSTNCVSYVNSVIFADVFVPIPPALWLWAGALATLVPTAKRVKNNNTFLRST